MRRFLLALLLAFGATVQAQDAGVKIIEQIDRQMEARNYGAAEELAKKLVADTVAKRGEAHDATIQALQQLSFVLESQKKYAASEPLRRRALAAAEKLYGRDHFSTAAAATFLAMNLQRQDKKAESEALFAQARGGREKSLGTVAPDAVAGITATELQLQGKFAEAEAIYRKLLAESEKSLGREHPDHILTLYSLAGTLLAQKKEADAEAIYRTAFALTRKSGRYPALRAQALPMARVLAQRGRDAQALEFYREVVEGYDAFFSEIAGWSDEERERSAAQFAPVLREMMEFLLRLHQKEPKAGHDRELLSVASRNQSRIFSELLRRSDVARFARDPAFAAQKQKRDALARKQTELAQQAMAMSGSGDAARRAALARQLEETSGALRLANETLARDYPRFVDLTQPRPVGVSELQARLLKPGEALICFVLLEKQALAFAVTRERFLLAARPLPRSEIAARVAAARRNAEQFAADGSFNALQKLDPAALHLLYRDLVAPVEDLLKGAERVLVVADGALAAFPLEMLVTRYGDAERKAFESARAAGGSAPLLGEYATLSWLRTAYRFSYLPSLSALASQRQYPKAMRPYEQELVSFADPVFSPEGAVGYSAATRSALTQLARARGVSVVGKSSGAQSTEAREAQKPRETEVSIPRLPETADEARSIAAILGGRSTLYLRDKAQERTVKTVDLSRARYLHFATHGFLGGEFLEVQAAQTRGRRGETGQPALALTLVGNLQGEDGLLTMKEVIEDLELSAALVVLSACNTAGESASALNGEGFAGLTRAFMYAGAKGLVVSHWSVESRSAQELITELFRELKGGKTPVAALAAAREKIAKGTLMSGNRGVSTAHPYFWAPFVFVGD